MDRDEILSRNKQRQAKDEGIEFVETQSKLYGEKALMIFLIVLMIYNFCKGISNYDLMTVFWAYMAFCNLYKYKAYKQKIDLVTVVASFIASLGFLASYLLKTW